MAKAKKMVKTDIPLLRKWIKALRSRKYTQGKCSLVRNYGERRPEYCCLGVACVVSGLTNDQIRDRLMLTDFKKGRELHSRLGLTVDKIGRVEVFGEMVRAQNALADLNDEQGKGFAYIASWIEKNVLKPAVKAQRKARKAA